jgi:hypothetical protein
MKVNGEGNRRHELLAVDTADVLSGETSRKAALQVCAKGKNARESIERD